VVVWVGETVALPLRARVVSPSPIAGAMLTDVAFVVDHVRVASPFCGSPSVIVLLSVVKVMLGPEPPPLPPPFPPVPPPLLALEEPQFV
jgi:hypothetical protein